MKTETTKLPSLFSQATKQTVPSNFFEQKASVEKFFDTQLNRVKEVLTTENLSFYSVQIDFSTKDFSNIIYVNILKRSITWNIEHEKSFDFIELENINFGFNLIELKSKKTANLNDAINSIVNTTKCFYNWLNATSQNTQSSELVNETPESKDSENETPENLELVNETPENETPENENAANSENENKPKRIGVFVEPTIPFENAQSSELQNNAQSSELENNAQSSELQNNAQSSELQNNAQSSELDKKQPKEKTAQRKNSIKDKILNDYGN